MVDYFRMDTFLPHWLQVGKSYMVPKCKIKSQKLKTLTKNKGQFTSHVDFDELLTSESI